jgi:DNA-binding Lrp family transcriptional regulator
VDDLDLSILRWMYPGGVWSPWGTDPRITPSEIASHVGLDRTAIWHRIRKWRREGFWDGFHVRMNLRTFGVGQVYAEIHVADSSEGWALLDKLEHTDGILEARVAFGDTMTSRDVELVVVEMVADDPAHVARRMRVLRQLSPTGSVEGPFREEAPPIARELTPLDWRIIAAIVANPNASPSRLAHLVGVTVKTFVRHHSALIDDHAVFYAPTVNWSRLGCVTLLIHCHDAAAIHRVQRAVETRFPCSIPMAINEFEGIGAEWNSPTSFAVIVPVRSPHEVQTLVRDLSMDSGVRSVRPEYWGPGRRFPGWVDQRIGERLAGQRAGAVRASAVKRSR